ncbi:MAG: hypothetical protein IT257_04085 [Chitinophagaceae bacterium]|nr:hypothetical protein [Chitinophagaceae bacterium]
MSKHDRVLLEKFWLQFRKALNAKRNLQLSKLIVFPFECGYCPNGAIIAKSVDRLVNRKLFEKEYFEIFFRSKLRRTVNNSTGFENLFVWYSYDVCKYAVGYVSTEPTRDNEGAQTLFTLAKVKGEFKIVSTYTVP